MVCNKASLCNYSVTVYIIVSAYSPVVVHKLGRARYQASQGKIQIEAVIFSKKHGAMYTIRKLLYLCRKPITDRHTYLQAQPQTKAP